MKKALFISSPLGFSEIGNHFMKGELFPLISSLGYEIINPWELTPQKAIDKVLNMEYGINKQKAWQKLNKIIAANNAQGIKRCDGVISILDGVDVDSGTASEIGYAAALGKPILGYRGDFRLSSDNEGAIINLQVEYFIRLHGGTIVTSVDQLKKSMPKIFK